MNDKIFLDTNILIYAFSNDELEKRKQVLRLIETSDHKVISTQVINEFVNVMNKKKKISFDKLEPIIEEFIDYFYISQISISTINSALKIAHKHNYSYFDSLMLASAIENNCQIIYSEDMHNNHKISNILEIKNPF